ncbi:MAG: hypothetical protein ACRC6F_08205 [Aeromonas sp.]
MMPPSFFNRTYADCVNMAHLALNLTVLAERGEIVSLGITMAYLRFTFRQTWPSASNGGCISLITR